MRRKTPQSRDCGVFFCGGANCRAHFTLSWSRQCGSCRALRTLAWKTHCTAERKRDDLVFWPSSQTEQARVRAMNEFVACAAEKLRRDSLAGRLMVFIHNIPSGRSGQRRQTEPRKCTACGATDCAAAWSACPKPKPQAQADNMAALSAKLIIGIKISLLSARNLQMHARAPIGDDSGGTGSKTAGSARRIFEGPLRGRRDAPSHLPQIDRSGKVLRPR